jgi:CO/xanthine dehydrogenase Mo-binding subunit
VGVPARALPLADVCMAAYFVPAFREEGKEALSSTRFYDPPANFSNGCIVVTAEVDIGTGGVTLERIVAVEDCGTVINPMVVEGQVYGAVTQGIGGALLEELAYDENAQMLASTFMDYLLPTAAEVPPIEVVHLETPSPFTIGGIKGMAEGGMVASPAAVLAAVADALAPFGARLGSMPMTPERVLSLIHPTP